MRHTKIAVIGAGAVGSTTAYALMLKNVAAEIVLVDINEDRCRGEVFDLEDALSFSDTSKIQSAHISDIKDSDIFIIAAGAAQKPGQTRHELVEINKDIIISIMQNLQPFHKDAIVIVVTNPVDAMTFFAQEVSGLPRSQVFGTGTFLDSQRLRTLLSAQLNIAEQSIHAYVLGEHGDTQFPAWSSARIAGVPLIDFPGITENDLDCFAKQSREKVYEIIKYKGATFFGIAACVSAMCENIIFDQKRIAPVSTFVEHFGVYLGMPAVLGCGGIERVIEVPLNEKEQKQLAHSAQKIRETIEKA